MKLPAVALALSEVLTIIALALFAYLGTFTRYLAADYCETMQVANGSVLKSLVWRYQHASDRYTNLLFDAFSEAVAPRNVRVLPVAMIALWTLALIWLVREARQLAGLQWPALVDAFLGSILAFFPIFEAPNRFQTLYWRSGLAVHFAPLVYLSGFIALLLMLIRRREGRTVPVWLGVACLLLAFLGGGFSEPPTAMLIAGTLITLFALRSWEHGPRRLPAMHLLGWTLAGGVAALAVMAASPANVLRLGTPPPHLPQLLYRTALFGILFIADSLKSLPLPTIVSIGMPALLFSTLRLGGAELNELQKRRVGVVMAVAPILMYVLIAASFAPSVYGQSYPIERARFAGRLMMTTVAILEGVCLGMLLGQMHAWRSRPVLVNLASLALVLSALYQVRGAASILKDDLPYAREWSAAWDARDSAIRAAKAAGLQEVVIPQLPGFENVRELAPRASVWINRCAAKFYGVKSIRAPQMESLH